MFMSDVPMSAAPAARPSAKPLSCGVVVLNAQGELLLCHVTGQGHWDLPKGGIHAGETPLAAALRETREETGLQLDGLPLLDLGRMAYTQRKDLHLFAVLLPRIDTGTLCCESQFSDAGGGRLPEMDGYGWFAPGDVAALCTRKLAAVLQERLNLDEVLRRLQAPGPGTRQRVA